MFVFASKELRVGVKWEDGKAQEIVLDPDESHASDSTPPVQVKRFFRELREYLAGKPRRFSLPINQDRLSAFARRVYRELAKTRCGETLSYAELAGRVGNPNAARAVGRVLASNPYPLVVPCHRVVGSNGSLTGFSAGLNLKARLLDIERRCNP